MNLEELAKLPARGIIFSGLMVKAILEDRKTNSRRLNKRWLTVKKGNLLWVRETWCQPFTAMIESRKVFYRANGFPISHLRFEGRLVSWKPSIFMPRWATRIYLEAAADARMERLQDITGEDANAEGFIGDYSKDEEGIKDEITSPEEKFAQYWDSLNGKKAPWESNPEIVVLEFRRISK